MRLRRVTIPVNRDLLRIWQSNSRGLLPDLHGSVKRCGGYYGAEFRVCPADFGNCCVVGLDGSDEKQPDFLQSRKPSSRPQESSYRWSRPVAKALF
jgi:hypothetical protein